MFVDSSSSSLSVTALGYDDPSWGPTAIPLHPSTMDKLAGSSYTPQRLLDFINNIRPRDDGRYILLNALGAGEYWGGNRNNDIFPEWSLRGDPPPPDIMDLVRSKGLVVPTEYGYKTFERYAFPFRQHCNNSPEFSIGDRVCCAAYNDKMHRVELIIFIYQHKAPDIVKRLDDGEPIPWSMGSKLPWDHCLCCGHVARNRAEYCDCLKNFPGKVFPDGRKVLAANYFPRFFDISEIMVPADRSAYSLRKVAGVMDASERLMRLPSDPEPVPAGMAKYAGLIDFLVSGGKEATIEKETPALEPAKNLGPSPVDPQLWKMLRGLVEKDEECSERIPHGLMDSLKEQPLDKVLPALTTAGIILKPNEVDSLTGGDEAKLPSSLDFSEPDPTILMKLRDLVRGRSMFDPHFSIRILRISKKEGDAPAKGITVIGTSGAANKYRDLLKHGIDLESLKEATAHPRVQMLLNPGSLERTMLELEAEAHPFHTMVLPFLAASGLVE